MAQLSINHLLEEEKCTLCQACVNVCPQSAIYKDKNQYGFEKLKIDYSKCIDCNACRVTCERRNEIKWNEPIKVYAAQARDDIKIRNSASGGAFQMLAELVLEKGGVCFGAKGYFDKSHYKVEHVRISSLKDLQQILNSKYVLSDIGDSYTQAKKDLLAGTTVLFSGTPCQIAGLKAFLKKDYPNLITSDVICHGVSSAEIFDDYINELKKSNNITIVEYLFRDKYSGWGSNFGFKYYKNTDTYKNVHSKHFPKEGGSFSIHYLRGDIHRENCYSCNYSRRERISDFTFGDYWAIELEKPELINKKTDRISIKKGINSVMVNTLKGASFIDDLTPKLRMYEVEYESVIAHNNNLSYPSSRGKNRQDVLDTYINSGYHAIEKKYRESVKKKMIVYFIKNNIKMHIPDRVRVILFGSSFLRKFLSGE